MCIVWKRSTVCKILNLYTGTFPIPEKKINWISREGTLRQNSKPFNVIPFPVYRKTEILIQLNPCCILARHKTIVNLCPNVFQNNLINCVLALGSRLYLRFLRVLFAVQQPEIDFKGSMTNCENYRRTIGKGAPLRQEIILSHHCAWKGPARTSRHYAFYVTIFKYR